MTAVPRRRRSLATRLLLVALLIVPLLEIAVIVMVGRTIGGWWTLALLLAWSAIGALIVRREWTYAWSALNTALRTGVMPARELTDAALVLVGGTLLLAPGFITDVIGLFLLLPFTRPISRVFLQAVVARRLLGATTTGFPAGYGSPAAGDSDAYPPRRNTNPDIIEGEIVDE